jgi:leishmanolysin-like peptidase
MPTTVTRQTINGPRSQTVSFIVTEAVRREARAHFGCSSLVGAELENQGGDATAGSHWEKRIFENEAMTGVTTQNPAFSRVTLAALEDSGWYQVNYDYAMAFRFGQNLGCSFTDESCYHWWTNNPSPLPYCNVQPPAGSTGRTDCTPDYYSKGRCNLVSFTSSVAPTYQYFSNSAQGGSVQIADYCPFYQEFSFVGGRRTHCSASANQPTGSSNVFAETYGSTSRCFRHGASSTWTVNGGSFTSTGGSGCYQYTCSPTGGLTVYVLGVQIACECVGKEVSFSITAASITYMGTIVCPACRDLCWDQTSMCPAATESCPGKTATVNGMGVMPTGGGTNPTSGATTAGIRSLLIVLTSCLVLWAV